MPRFAKSRYCLCTIALIALAVGTAQAAKQKGRAMSYGEDREFLAKHTKVVELTNEDGARVAVTPDWQGRVMTSTCDGPGGTSFGFINRGYIKKGEEEPAFQQPGRRRADVALPRGGAVQPLVQAWREARVGELVYAAGVQRRQQNARTK